MKMRHYEKMRDSGIWRRRTAAMALACLWALLGGKAVAQQAAAQQEKAQQAAAGLPATAVLCDMRGPVAVYINPEAEETSSVWVVNQETGSARMVCVTNPESPVRWAQMAEPEADAVEVSMSEIAAAERGWICPGDELRIIVEGCPDARNVWSYIIDVEGMRAWQLPSSEGVVALNLPNEEIIAASYGYDEDGRYRCYRAYSPQGKYLHAVGDKERE